MADSNNGSLIHDHDHHWKHIVETLFEDFIDFFLPDLYPKVDFSKLPVSREQELPRLFHNKEDRKGKALVDKLFDVVLKGGAVRKLLIHAEFQSSNNRKNGRLPERMFRYFYLIRERYKQDITAIAIYTTKSVPKPHDRYIYDCEGLELNYKFNAYRVHDTGEEALLAHKNPFALVVLACQYLNETTKNVDRRVMLKMKLVELAFIRGYEEKQVGELLTFIEFMLTLPDEQDSMYVEESKKVYKKIIAMPATKARKDWADYIYQLVHGNLPSDLRKQAMDAKKALAKSEKARIKAEEDRIKAEEDKIKTAINFLKMGLPAEKVAKATGFSLAKIIELQQQK